MERPFGSNWDFRDAGWILPFGFVMFAMLIGDFAWVSGLMVVGNLILSGHLWYEMRQNMSKKDQGNWLLYIIGAFLLSLFLATPIMFLFALLGYAVIAGKIKKRTDAGRLQPQYYKDRVATFQRMSIMGFAMICIFGVKYLAITDDVRAAQEQRLIKEGVIAPSQAKYNK